jgi:hypothetical protein
MKDPKLPTHSRVYQIDQPGQITGGGCPVFELKRERCQADLGRDTFEEATAAGRSYSERPR